MKISVLVPSYGRPDSLKVCLDALIEQDRAPDEVVVVTREGDLDTRALIKKYQNDRSLPLNEQVVTEPGQVLALNTASRASSGDVVAITDDDAAPRPDWTKRLESWFSHPRVVGVGGRDVVIGCENENREPVVGLVRRWGKVIGNHHLGMGKARNVDVLKGVNMAFRYEPLMVHGFDTRLRGKGAQVHNDLKLSLALRREGHRLVYDPEVIVDHFPAQRPEGDSRLDFDLPRHVDAVHNETLALLEFLTRPGRLAFAAWSVLIGRSQGPGMLHSAWTAVRRPGTGSWVRFKGTLTGRWEGWRTFRTSPRIR